MLAAGAQERIVGKLFMDSTARRHLELAAEYGSPSNFGLVGQPFLDPLQRCRDVRLPRMGSGVRRILRPFRPTDRLAGLRPVLLWIVK